MAFADFNEIDDDKPFLATRIVRLGMHSAPLIATPAQLGCNIDQIGKLILDLTERYPAYFAPKCSNMRRVLFSFGWKKTYF